MVSTFVLIYFGRTQLILTTKADFITFQAVVPEICSILVFNKTVWDQLLHHILCMIFQEKYFACYIIWPKFIVWLLLFLKISGNMCIVIICCPVPDVISFEIKYSFLIKPFFYITKKSEQKCQYLKNEKSF